MKMTKLKPGVTVRIGAREYKGSMPSELVPGASPELKNVPKSKKSDESA